MQITDDRILTADDLDRLDELRDEYRSVVASGYRVGEAARVRVQAYKLLCRERGWSVKGASAFLTVTGWNERSAR